MAAQKRIRAADDATDRTYLLSRTKILLKYKKMRSSVGVIFEVRISMINNSITAELIAQNIHLIRNQKVMLSGDLAKLYGVAPKVLIQAVKRSKDRFPADFMFQLSFQEVNNLRSQIVTTND